MRYWLPHNIILHHIHLLQLENYSLWRFLAAVRNKFIRQKDGLPDIDWTYKLYLVTILAFLLQLEVIWLGTQALSLSLIFTLIFGLAGVIVLTYVYWAFLSVAVLLVWPLDWVLRYLIIWRAKRILKRCDPKIVGIAGSYGKTITKETIATLLAEKYTVAKTPGNKNTPLGIARAIRKNISEETDVFVVEMGEFHRGDIKDLCDIARPDVAVITGINEAHLERLGSVENTIATILEVVEYAHDDATVVANADDEIVRKHVSDASGGDQKLTYYSAHNRKEAPYRTTDRQFHTDGSGISFELMKGAERIGTFKVPHLAEYIIGNIIAALLVGEALGTPPHEIRAGISRLRPAPHRLEPVQMPEDIVVIDDSYNGNPDGAAAAIDTLAKFEDRRKMYVTPGLVEMGKKSERIHRKIGQQLAEAADIVVLVDTSAAAYIKDGLSQADFDGGIVMVDSTEAARGYLSGHVQKGDVVLFQNDWPENYV